MNLKSLLLITKYFHPVLVLFLLGLLTPNHQIGATVSSATEPVTTRSLTTGSSITSATTIKASTTVPTTTSVKPITTPPSPIVQVAHIIYRGSGIRIFADVRTYSRFFYDPLVQLDPMSIISRPHLTLNHSFVSFNIDMWNPELRRQVFDRLKSLNGQHFNLDKIVEEDIYVLPFVEIQLYSDKPAEGTYSRQSYNGQDKYLYFKIQCSSRNGAEVLAEDLRRDPESVMQKWNMTCSGLNLGNQLGKEIVYTYRISPSNPTPTAPTSTTTEPTPTPSPSQPIVEVSKVSYRGSIIRIFADAGVKNHSRFFYEPLVHLDPKSIIAHPHGLLKWDVVSFTIEMWNSELRRQVLARVKSLKSLPNVTVDEQDVYVLPFETIQLTHGVLTTINSSVEVGMMNTSKSYLRQSESLQFYLITNSTTSANGIAENFRHNPGYVLELWNVTLVGHGLDLGNQLGKKLVYKYPIATCFLTSCSSKQ